MVFTPISPYQTDYREGIRKKEFNSPSHHPILFIHGWSRSSGDFNDFKQWFEVDGWPSTGLYSYNFDDRSNCTVEANINNALMISLWVDEILNDTGSEKIDLVGHSMGGLSSRYYIKFLDGLDKVDGYVSIGSPHHGENIASCGAQGVNALAAILNEGDETPGGILNDTIGDRIDPISGVTYNSTHVPGNISYTSIYSIDDAMPSISPPLDGATNTEVEGLAHIELLSSTTVYAIIKTAVNVSFPDPTSSITTQTTTQTSISTETTGWSIFPFLLMFIPIFWFRRKK